MLGVSLAGYTKETTPVTLNEFDLSELLDAIRAGGDIDVIRKSVELVLQALIEVEATERIGAALHERTETRTTQRNGHRARLLSTKAGDVELAVLGKLSERYPVVEVLLPRLHVPPGLAVWVPKTRSRR